MGQFSMEKSLPPGSVLRGNQQQGLLRRATDGRGHLIAPSYFITAPIGLRSPDAERILQCPAVDTAA